MAIVPIAMPIIAIDPVNLVGPTSLRLNINFRAIIEEKLIRILMLQRAVFLMNELRANMIQEKKQSMKLKKLIKFV